MAIVLFSACEPSTSATNDHNTEAPSVEPQPALSFTDHLEAAHQKEAFRSHTAIQFDLQLFFGGTERLNGTLTLTTDSGKGVIALKNGEKVYFQNDQVYHAPDSERAGRARFDAYTWSYFFLFPYKLSDAGTHWTDYPDKELNGSTYLAEKLSFSPGTGDAPDDWYIAYAEPESQLIEVAAYIVTAGQSQAEAEEDPHAIQYLNYEEVDGVPIAREWKFWAWRTDEGLTEQLGEATLKSVSFVEPEAGFFTPPADYVAG